MLNKFKKCTKLTLDNKYNHVENAASYCVEQNGSNLDIYFEKSNGATDWKNNFAFIAKPYRDMKNLWFCHRGFLKVWKSIEPHIANLILDPKIKTINIVGYSHGGAIAQLCYEYVKFNRPDVKVTGFGFGAPRVLWGFASKAVKERFKGFVVVKNGEDIVTKMPPTVFGFRHLCEVLEVGISINGIEDHRAVNYVIGLEGYEEANKEVV